MATRTRRAPPIAPRLPRRVAPEVFADELVDALADSETRLEDGVVGTAWAVIVDP